MPQSSVFSNVKTKCEVVVFRPLLQTSDLLLAYVTYGVAASGMVTEPSAPTVPDDGRSTLMGVLLV